MSTQRKGLVRIMHILHHLRDEARGTASPGRPAGRSRRVNARTLAETLECSGRTIQRDIEALRDAGYDIDYDENAHTLEWKNAREVEPVPLMTATEDEVVALTTALALSGTLLDNAAARHLETFLGKLEHHLEDGFLHPLEDVRASLSYLPTQVAVNEAPHWTDIQRAILNERGLEITYASPHYGDDPHTYALEPFRLVHLDGAWYVIGRKRGAGTSNQDLRLFRLSRIQSLATARWTVAAPPPPAALIDERMRFGLGAWQGDEIETVKMRIDADVAGFVRERAWNPSHRFTEEPDGDWLLEFETAHADKIMHFVLEWSPHIELLEPHYLRPLIANLAESARKLHKATRSKA